MADGSTVVSLLNKYDLWRLITAQSVDENGEDVFTFEAWVNTVEEKTNLFNALKPFVNAYGEQIDWHECPHDEAEGRSCVIAESYEV